MARANQRVPRNRIKMLAYIEELEKRIEALEEIVSAPNKPAPKKSPEPEKPAPKKD